MKNKIKEAFNELNPEELQERKIFYKIKSRSRKIENKFRFSFKKPIIILASLILVISTVIPTLASKSAYIYDLMYLVSPTVAQHFMPIQKFSIDNDIKMEVVSAYVHENIAEIYITMKDLNGNRIDETTDLNDSYSINRPFSGSATAENIGYDEETRKATFLITISEWGNKKITGDKITFSVKELISGKKVYSEVPIEIDLIDIDGSPSTHRVSSNGGSGSNYEKYVPDFETTALVPSNPMEFPIEEIDFTGIGYIDNMLHIQISVENNLTKDNHGYFFLKDKNGNIIELDYDFGYMKNSFTNNRIDYYEYVFDIPQSEIENYLIFGNFWTSTLFTEGKWQVTFPLEDIKEN